MSNQNDTIEETLKTWNYCKNFFSLLKQGKFGPAVRELWPLSKAFYTNNLKGKYVEVKGRKIPLTAVLIVVLFGLYFVFSPSGGAEVEESGKAYIVNNAYEKDGLRVYDLKKCNASACGYIENGTNNHYEHIKVKLVFYGPTGKSVAEGTADAWEMAPRTRAEFTVPCSEEFAYPKLIDVLINPKLDAEEDDVKQAPARQPAPAQQDPAQQAPAQQAQ